LEPIFLQQWELEAVDISAVESPACRFMDVSCQDARSSSERDDALEELAHFLFGRDHAHHHVQRDLGYPQYDLLFVPHAPKLCTHLP